MSGVQKGSKRGPYAKRQQVDTFESIEESTDSVKLLAARLGPKLIVAMRRAVRKQNLTADQHDILINYLNG